MKPRFLVACLSIFFIIWLPIIASALPHEAPEVPFAADQTPDSLILYCGFPGEFDPVHPVSPTMPKPNAAFSPLVTMHAVETTTRTQVPEPATLVLLGVGLIGVIAFVKRTWETI